MATGYHFAAKAVSRGKGQSVIAKAAYNARDELRDEQTGELKNYKRGHSEILFEGIFAPKDAPAWALEREALWNEVERTENRKNSQFAREVELAFPHQLTEQQREWVIKDFVRENFVRQGMVADVAIHAPDQEGDERNYHAHILLTLRRLGADGFEGNKVREWNQTATLEGWREDWAQKCGRMLERAGFDLEGARWKSAHLTLAEQCEAALERGDQQFAAAVDHEPGQHLGAKVISMMERGVETERGAAAVARGMADGLDQLTGRVASAVGKVMEAAAKVALDVTETVLDGLASAFGAGDVPLTLEQRKARVADQVERQQQAARDAELRAKEAYEQDYRDKQERERRDDGLRR